MAPAPAPTGDADPADPPAPSAPTTLNPAFPYRAPSIFATMSALAATHGAVNLGQGFPEEDGPEEVKAAAAEALLGTPQQYAHPAGLPSLRAALASYEATLGASPLDPDTQVLVTAGATEALAACILSLVRPGEEVVLIDPSYDSYAPLVRCAGGVPVPLRLVAPADASSPWALPPEPVLASLFHPGETKLLILNTPHNPTGHVFSRAELEGLSKQVARCRGGDGASPTRCIVICDEVYAALVLPDPPSSDSGGRASAGGANPAASVLACPPSSDGGGNPNSSDRPGGPSPAPPSGSAGDAQPAPANHISLASLPGMAPACLRVGSAGKTFSLTGWKCGWVTGPADLVAAVAGAHQFLTFSVPGCLQAGVAHGLDHCRPFIAGLGSDLAAKRARLAPALREAGFRVLPSEATYFLTADASNLLLSGEDDAAFCVRLVEGAGVAAIPLSPFYTRPASPAEAAAWVERGVDELQPSPPTSLVRFCFAKRDATLDAAAAALQAYFK